MNRRRFLQALGLGGAAFLPLAGLLGGERIASAGPAPGTSKRIIFFYFPDGIPEPEGSASKFHMSGSENSFALADTLTPLAPFQSQCVFMNGLSMGATDVGSHPGGAKKLLTGVDGGGGESIDRYLARTVGAGAPFKHLYLGAMANQNNASGDKYISYPSANTTVGPEDSPLLAFQRLFGTTGTVSASGPAVDSTGGSVIDAVLADMNDVRWRLGDTERSKLDLHLEALREVEKRVKGGGAVATASCTTPRLDTTGWDPTAPYDPAGFPAILRAQIDVMVQAMACGLTQVGVIQASQHTSELIMSRWPGTDMYKPNFDMRSHQASHYGVPSDPKFADYAAQVKWFVAQFAYLLDQLKQRPEGAGTMLDNSLVLLCSEVSDGNTHKHDNMPFILAGKGGGAIRTGRLLDYGYRRHSDLLVSLGQAMGDPMTSFGQASSGPLPNLF